MSDIFDCVRVDGIIKSSDPWMTILTSIINPPVDLRYSSLDLRRCANVNLSRYFPLGLLDECGTFVTALGTC